MSAPAATDASAPPKAKGKKTILIVLIAVVLLLAIAGGAWMFLGRAHDEDAEEAPTSRAKEKDKAPPVFLPMDNMVVNLADPGGEKFAQIGLTIEVMDQKTSDKVKSYLPTIRSGVLMLVSQRTSEELLTKDGKEKLVTDIHREVSKPLGYTIDADEEKAVEEVKPKKKGEAPAKKAKAKAKTEPNPVYGVLFSSFIIQ